MKKFLSLIAIILSLPLQAADWKEGTHYDVISDKGTSKPVVQEYFSFWCPACNAVEPVVQQMKAKLESEGVKFEKVHVNFMRFADEETQNAASRAMMIGRALKQEEKLNGAIFAHIHKQRQPVTSLDDLKGIYVSQGVSAERFDEMAESFAVNSLLARNNKTLEQNNRHLTKGVPAFLINGKYRAMFTRDMTPDQVIELIVWLAKQP
ncbi:thiol:disulfide interchange protein DsbA/DsbL [Bowmanella yangjiangensis]|uniref:Thiol:disulfide interchange protein n=1 Tax=Bowmanella yangjiangensis TaxID=2811230 RepID=A0ABS3CX72_9ALTE|nr:thiol:disulfide interchange protein DsbA/DsbL [Bowmanella yangjiangensis]MBN7821705.1 thiol:disulfide interchange protein DsbA/DsbL [Bowmanella yangjiangensis]